MIQKRSTLVSGIALVLVIGLGLGVCMAALAGADGSTEIQSTATRAALFTDAQATTGEGLYRQSCAACHGAALTGGTAPPLTGPAFQASWGNPRVTLADLFFIIRTTMPPRASSSLSPPDHAAA